MSSIEQPLCVVTQSKGQKLHRWKELIKKNCCGACSSKWSLWTGRRGLRSPFINAPSNAETKNASSLFHALIKWKLWTFEYIGGKTDKVQNLYLHNNRSSPKEKDFAHILSHLEKNSWRVVWGEKNLFSCICINGKKVCTSQSFLKFI